MILGRDRKRLEELEKGLADLRELHRDLYDLPAQWEDWLHKIRNVLARLNQRAKSEEAAGEHTPLQRRSYNPAALRLLGFDPNGDDK